MNYVNIRMNGATIKILIHLMSLLIPNFDKERQMFLCLYKIIEAYGKKCKLSNYHSAILCGSDFI